MADKEFITVSAKVIRQALAGQDLSQYYKINSPNAKELAFSLLSLHQPVIQGTHVEFKDIHDVFEVIKQKRTFITTATNEKPSTTRFIRDVFSLLLRDRRHVNNMVTDKEIEHEINHLRAGPNASIVLAGLPEGTTPLWKALARVISYAAALIDKNRTTTTGLRQ